MKKKVAVKGIFVIFSLVFLMDLVCSAQIYFDGFEGGSLSNWTLSTNATCANWFVSSYIDVNHIAHSGSYFAQATPGCSPTNDPGSRMEKAISTENYQNINISYYKSLHGLDGGDFFRVKWFNGTRWNVLEEIENIGVHEPYSQSFFSLNSSAFDNPSFKIRFECTALTSTTEYCQVDDFLIQGELMDIIPPAFSNYVESPVNSSEYSQGQNYQFNITIVDSNSISNVKINFNGTNYSVTNFSSTYKFNMSDLPAGVYPYYWWANDSNGNSNRSETRYFYINKAASISTLSAIPSSIAYGQNSNFSCFDSQGLTTNLYINGTLKNDEKGSNIIRAGGSYNLTCISENNQNYTGGKDSEIFNIEKAAGGVFMSLNGNSDNTQIQYPEKVNVSVSTPYGSAGIFRNSLDITEENNVNQTIGVGYYNYTAISTGNQNYSSASVTYFLNITKGSPIQVLEINGLEENLSLVYLQNANVSGRTNGGVVNLFRNNISVDADNNQNRILGAGLYEFKMNVSGNQNYTDGDDIYLYLNISKASPDQNMQIVFNPSGSVAYGTTTTAQASESNVADSDLIYLLYRDGVLVSSLFPWSNTANLNAGSYLYIFNTSGGQNYTSGSLNATLIVNKVTNPVSLLLNGVRGNLALNYSQKINASGGSSSGNFDLYRNGQLVNDESNLNVTLAAGVHNYHVNSSGNQNFVANSSGESFSVTVGKSNPLIDLKLNGTKNNLSITDKDNVLISASRIGEGNLSIFINGIEVYAGNIFSSTYNFSAGNINVTAYYSETENYSFSHETLWLSVSDATEPRIQIYNPSNNSAFGYNESLKLNYSAKDGALDSCWYNLNHGANISLSLCQNTIFDVEGSGNYELNLYSNDSFGNLAHESVSFSVNLGAPTIMIGEPSGFLKNGSVYFSYNPSDLDLDICELWGNFSGVYGISEIHRTPINDATNYFSLSLSDGSYIWSVRCNDSLGHYQSTGNRSFFVDSGFPEISLTSPSGLYNTRSVNASWNINDLTPVSCKYNVFRGENAEISNTSVYCSLNSVSFNMTIDATNFIFNFYAVDSAGNENHAQTNFSIDTAIEIPVVPPIGGGGGSGSASGGFSGGIVKSNLEITPIKIIAPVGETRSLKAVVKNIGRTSANKCKLVAFGNEKYLETKDVFNIGIGEIVEFNFLFNVIDEEASKTNISLVCIENVSKPVPFDLVILENKLGVSIESIKLSGNNVIVNYKIEASSTTDENLFFRILDAQGDIIKEENKKVSLQMNKIFKDEISIALPDDETGMLKLWIGDGKEVVYVEENFIYGGNTITGFALANLIENYSYIGIILILFIVAGVVVTRRIFQLRRKKMGLTYKKHLRL